MTTSSMRNLLVSLLAFYSLVWANLVLAKPTDCIYIDLNESSETKSIDSHLGVLCFYTTSKYEELKAAAVAAENDGSSEELLANNNSGNDDKEIIRDEKGELDESFRLAKSKRSFNSKLAMQNLKITRLKRPPLPFRIGGRLHSRYNSLVVEKP